MWNLHFCLILFPLHLTKTNTSKSLQHLRDLLLLFQNSCNHFKTTCVTIFLTHSNLRNKSFGHFSSPSLWPTEKHQLFTRLAALYLDSERANKSQNMNAGRLFWSENANQRHHSLFLGVNSNLLRHNSYKATKLAALIHYCMLIRYQNNLPWWQPHQLTAAHCVLSCLHVALFALHIACHLPMTWLLRSAKVVDGLQMPQ